MLNGQQMGGKRRSAYYYDLWCMKYLPKFKWDHLTGAWRQRGRATTACKACLFLGFAASHVAWLGRGLVCIAYHVR